MDKILEKLDYIALDVEELTKKGIKVGRFIFRLAKKVFIIASSTVAFLYCMLFVCSIDDESMRTSAWAWFIIAVLYLGFVLYSNHVLDIPDIRPEEFKKKKNRQ